MHHTHQVMLDLWSHWQTRDTLRETEGNREVKELMFQDRKAKDKDAHG